MGSDSRDYQQRSSANHMKNVRAILEIQKNASRSVVHVKLRNISVHIVSGRVAYYVRIGPRNTITTRRIMIISHVSSIFY